jgi:hypothetical protein
MEGSRCENMAGFERKKKFAKNTNKEIENFLVVSFFVSL